MKLIYEGHACFRIITKGTEILIDPYISGNPLCKKTPADLHPDLILVTHGHGDHLGDALPIAKANGAVLAAQVDLLAAVEHKDIETVSFNLGGSFVFRGIKITMVPAWHGNSISTANGSVYAGVACGFVIDDGESKIYHAGDTALFGDMATVISRYRLDCALLPIGDFYTMGPDDAVTAAQWLRAKTVIPMHYNTFPAIKQDALAFKEKTQQEAGCECVILAPEDEWEVNIK